MESEDKKPVLRCDNIIASSRGMAETHGNKVVIFVPAPEIDRVTLRFGRAEHRPVVSLSIGAVMASIGIFGLIEFFLSPRGYRYELGMAAFGLIGGTLIFDTLKERYFLEVKKREDICRLVFSKKVQKKDIDAFCEEVRKTYNYQIGDDSHLAILDRH